MEAIFKPPYITHLDEVGVLGVPDRHDGVHLLDQLLLLVVVEVHVPLGESRLPRAILDQDEPDLINTVKPVLMGPCSMRSSRNTNCHCVVIPANYNLSQ